MKIAIYGAGAIGGYLGAMLSLDGADVTLIARGPHLDAMQSNGLTLRIGGEERVAHPTCVDNPRDAGTQDYVIITLKAHSVPGVVDLMQPLLGPATAIVTATNGVPWWYFYKLAGAYENRRIECVDPGGVQWDGLGPERVIGCVVYPACEIEEPGVVRHLEGDRFSLGEPDGERSERTTALAQALVAAGLKAPVRPRIRDEIWVKLWGNLAFNPLSALTRATLDVVAGTPETRAIARAMMVEAREIAEALGVRFAIDVDQRIEGAAAVGAHTTSMLQDLELGRPMEIDALVSAVQELGRIVGVKTPTIDMVLGLVCQLGRTRGLYPTTPVAAGG